MVKGSVNLRPLDFQEDVVTQLIDICANSKAKQTITIKSPTGSGKTVILVEFIDEYLTTISDNTAFIWLCPGKGDLEEQSRDKMCHITPDRPTQSLHDALLAGFIPGTTTFVNWELVISQNNRALQDNERKNLYDRIAEAHRAGTDFVIIIDEEHSNDTPKAKNIIDAFSASHIIRASATAKENKKSEFIEIDEMDVINEGLITKAIYVNEGVENNIDVDDDYNYLLDLADEKRKAIAARYGELGKNIRPLVLIQFQNAQPEMITAVEEKLASMGYTYDNGMASIWMSGEKRDLPENLTENDGQPVFLLMKQAISTGWDCPRAKILVKLRDGMSETFEIQTIGRIRRMPEATHYDDDLLDMCYVYTFDEKFKECLLSDLDKAYEVRRLFLKDKCKTFTLEKQIRDMDFDSLGDRDVFFKIYDYMVDKYGLAKDKDENRRLLEEAGYEIGSEIIGHALTGEFVHTEKVMEGMDYVTTHTRVKTGPHGIRLLHCVDAIKSSIGLSNTKTKVILERLFRENVHGGKKFLILSLSTNEFYAFIINNYRLLRRDFKEVTSDIEQQMEMALFPKTATFYIPEEDLYRYDPGVKNEIEYLSNAYKEYTSGFATTVVRSISEALFEQYCENKDDIDWVYKNGDKGQQYFSIVYLDALQKQWLFYADYILKMKDGTIWVIETKGGESHGVDKNIDPQVINKFNAFKNYAEEKGVKWGFVRDKDNRLYINNTEYASDMADEHWIPLEDEL